MTAQSKFSTKNTRHTPNHNPRLTDSHNKPITEINFIQCFQLNLHRSENPTAQFYYEIEQSDELPYIAFVQEPYCVRGKPKHLPGNGVTYYYPTPPEVNPRATLSVSKNLANQFFFQMQFSDRDTVTCSIELPKSKLYVSSIYMDGTSSQDPPEVFIKLAEHCLQHKYGLIIGTDSNAHHTSWGNRSSDARGNNLLQRLAQAGLLWANNGKHTWRRNDQFSAIDLTLRNEYAPTIEGWDTNPEFSLSDHILIEFVINLHQEKIKIKPTRTLNTKKVDWTAYKSAVREKVQAWSKEKSYSRTYRDIHKTTVKDLNAQINKLNNILYECFTKSCPPTFIRNRKRFSWWTKGLSEAEIELIKARNDHESDPHDTYLQNRYNEAHKALNTLITEESTNNWKAFCSGLEKQKDVSKICKALLGNKNSPINALRKPDGTYTETPKETLELLSTTLYTSTTPNYDDLAPCSSNTTLNDIINIISINRLDEAVGSLKKNKSPGHDNISNEMLTEAYDYIKGQLLNIMRISLFHSKIPVAWQTSNSAILSKPGKDDYYTAKSYRIITLSSCTLKLMEKLILWHLQRDLKMDLALSPKQYGFRKGCSTEAAILKLVSKIESALKIGNFSLGIFLDIAGAFDNIPFTAIKRALEKSKAKGNVSNWILHLITTRKLKLNLKGIAIIIWILAGCPQGGVLSPFLWNIVLDSLLILLDTINELLAFADDLAIILTGFDLSTLRDLGQEYLRIINKWCQDNGLKLNAIKTQIIIFSRKNNLNLPLPIKLHGIEIEFCKTIKYLGVNLDNRLNWHKHVNTTARKCTNILFAARKMIGDNWGVTPDKMIWVYNAIIKPIMTYACVTWAPRLLENKSAMKSLEKPGNLSLLIATGALKSSSQEVLHQLFDLLPASLELEKTALLQSLRLKSHEHWPSLIVDHSIRKSFEPCTIIIDRILNRIFNPFNIKDYDFTHPIDISHKHYHLSINDRDMIPHNPDNNTITAYTDGSKHTNTDNSTGYGVIIFINEEDCITENYQLSTFHTVFQCEAHALYRASILLQDILSSPSYNENKVIIYTDSQALIKALSKSDTRSKQICNLHNSLNKLSTKHLIQIEWIPGHEGHEGNEKADSLANIRCNTTNQELEKYLPCAPNSHFKNKIRDHIKLKFRNRWKDCKISHKTKELVTAIIHHNLTGQHLFKLGTELLKPLTRLITGHNGLNHFQNKLDFTTVPFCSYCEQEIRETALHLICECERFKYSRMQKFGEDPITIDQAIRCISLSKELKLTTLLDFVNDDEL